MKTHSVIITRKNLEDPDLKSRLLNIVPSSVILDIREPRDMIMIEEMLKLGIPNNSIVPSLCLMCTNASSLANMYAQTREILETQAIVLRTTGVSGKEIFMKYLEVFWLAIPANLVQKTMSIHLSAPGSHFLDKNSSTNWILDFLSGKPNVIVNPFITITELDGSLAIFSEKVFLNYIQNRFVTINFATTARLDKTELFAKVNYLLGFGKDLVFQNFHDYEVFTAPAEKIMDDNIRAIVKVDRSSTYNNEKLQGTPTRKLAAGHELELVYIEGNVAKTLDGDYIHLSKIKIEK